MKKVLYILLVIILISALTIAFYSFQWDIFNPLHSETIKIDNIKRKFYYHIPENISQNPKLIFVLHGSKIGAILMQLVTGHQFNKLADKTKDVIIVYPEGYKKYWNDCKKAGARETKKKNLDDVAFFERMIDFFAKKYHIDNNEVFATGVSGGGQMCFKLAKEKPELFKGFATISASLPVESNNDCFESNKAVSILIMNGTADPINPYNGGEMISNDGEKRGAVMSTQQTIEYWLNLLKCDFTIKTENIYPDINKNDNSTAIEYDYKCLADNKEIKLIKIINGGHNIPNPTFFLWPKKVGNINKDINAPKIIFEYFMNLK